MLNYFHLLLFSFLSSTLSFAQSREVSQLEWIVSAGYQHTRLLDLNVSPLLFAANNGTIGLDLHRTKEKSTWLSGLAFTIGNSQSVEHGQRSAVITDPADLYGNVESYTYVLNPKLSFIEARICTGVYFPISEKGFSIGANVLDNFTFSALGADTWFFNHLSVQTSLFWKRDFAERHQIKGKISTSIFSYNVRRPFANDPSLPHNSYFVQYLKTGSSITSVHKFQQVDLELSYNYQFNEKHQIGILYRFKWFNFAEINKKNLGMYSNSLSLTYTF